MNISLGPQWEAFIAEHIERGHYQSPSEVVLEGLRLLREEESACPPYELEALGREVDKGLRALERGAFVELDGEALKLHMDTIKARGHARLSEQGS